MHGATVKIFKNHFIYTGRSADRFVRQSRMSLPSSRADRTV